MSRHQSGELRQKVIWQTSTSAPVDGSCGEDVETWTTQRTLCAKVLPTAGSVPFNAEQLKPIRTLAITMRGGPAIRSGDRLLFKGRTLTVVSVVDAEERGFWLDIVAAEPAQGVAGGP